MTQNTAPSNAELAACMQKIIYAIEDVREDTLATDRAVEMMDGTLRRSARSRHRGDQSQYRQVERSGRQTE